MLCRLCRHKQLITMAQCCFMSTPAGEGTVTLGSSPKYNMDEMAQYYSQMTLKEITEFQRKVFSHLGFSDTFYEEALLRGIGGGTSAPGANNTVVTTLPQESETPKESSEEMEKRLKEEEKAKLAKKTSFDVMIESYPAANKIKMIKELRTVTNLSLKEAKDAIEKTPGIIVKSLDKEGSEKLKKAFEDLQAVIKLM